MNVQELQRIQKILIRLHICILLIVMYFTLKAYAATEPMGKAIYIFTSLTFGVGVAWIHIQAWSRRLRERKRIMNEIPIDRPLYITISAIDCYAGQEAFHTGMILRLRKDQKNQFDDETIDIFGPKGMKYGRVANSVQSVCRGTHSAGYVYHAFGQETECRVMFICEDFAIAEVILEEKTEVLVPKETCI